MMNINDYRQVNHDIDPIYINRWSPRSFADKQVPESILNSLFEAARWAPSAANIQPWRFIFAKNAADRETFSTFINKGNISWSQNAPVLVAIVSQKTWPKGDDINPTHAFDTGAAWGYFALEAARKGLVAHGMGGFDREKAKKILNLPDDYEVNALAAIGYQGELDTLEEHFHEREKPSNRKPIDVFTFEGKYNQISNE